MTEVILEVDGVSKAFGAVKALVDARLELRSGEIHALVGENGAGKSTLMNLLGGILVPDGGEIRLAGRAVCIPSPLEAQRLGIALVHQEISLCPSISVYENILMAEINAGPAWLDHRALKRRAGQVLAPLGMVELEAKAGELPLSQQQLVEIAKALSLDCRILILDEPTAALTEPEAQALFAIMRRLRERGIAIIYISHRMAEIFSLCERITIFRDGRFIACERSAQTTPERLVERMVGREVSQLFPVKRTRSGAAEALLEVRNLDDGRRLHQVGLRLERGEILGLAGLVGAGRSEIAQAICGLAPRPQGEVLLDGEPLPRGDYAHSVRRGLVYLSEDRKESGLFTALSIAWNLSALDLRPLRGWAGLLSRRRELARGEALAERVRLRRGAMHDPLSSLSGGNQQKVALARLLAVAPRVMLLDEPTRGVDVGARAEIYRLLRELTGQGIAILVISSELVELIGLCDRVLVIREGRVAGELSGAEINQARIAALASGVAGGAALAPPSGTER